MFETFKTKYKLPNNLIKQNLKLKHTKMRNCMQKTRI